MAGSALLLAFTALAAWLKLLTGAVLLGVGLWLWRRPER